MRGIPSQKKLTGNGKEKGHMLVSSTLLKTISFNALTSLYLYTSEHEHQNE